MNEPMLFDTTPKVRRRRRRPRAPMIADAIYFDSFPSVAAAVEGVLATMLTVLEYYFEVLDGWDEVYIHELLDNPGIRFVRPGGSMEVFWRPARGFSMWVELQPSGLATVRDRADLQSALIGAAVEDGAKVCAYRLYRG